MKKIKFVIIAVVALLGLIYQSELFNMESYNFSTSWYLSSTISFSNEGEHNAILKDLLEKSKNSNVSIFFESNSELSQLKSTLDLYCDSYGQKTIGKQLGYYEGSYQSVGQGSMDIFYHPIDQILDDSNRYISEVSYIGNRKDIVNLYQSLEYQDQLSFPEITNSADQDQTYIMWGIIAFLIILLSLVDTIYSKKEFTVKVAMGASVPHLIAKEIGTELGVDFGAMAVAELVSRQFCKGTYMHREVLIIFGIATVCSCCCKLLYGRYDIKKCFSNVDDSSGILFVTYGIKCIVTCLTVFVLTTNFSILQKNLQASGKETMTSLFSNYSFVYLDDLKPVENEDGDLEEQFQHDFYKDVTKKYLDAAKIAICSLQLEDTDHDLKYIDVNQYAKETLVNCGFKVDSDAIIYIPKSKANVPSIREDANDCLNAMVNDTSLLNPKTVIYDDTTYFTYFDDSTSEGTSIVKNPIIVYANIAENNIQEDIFYSLNFNNVLFQITDQQMSDIQEEFYLAEKGYSFYRTDADQLFTYYQNKVRRIVTFCCSIVTFCLFLQVLLLLILAKLEFRNNAVEIMLKKVIGYSSFKRNRRLYVTSIVFYLLTIGGLMIAGKLNGWFSSYLCIAVGMGLMMVELLIVSMNIIRIERQNISKVLKGGCL